MNKLESMRAREQAAGDTVYERIQTTGVQGYVARTKRPQWAIDQAVLLDIAEAAARAVVAEQRYIAAHTGRIVTDADADAFYAVTEEYVTAKEAVAALVAPLMEVSE